MNVVGHRVKEKVYEVAQVIQAQRHKRDGLWFDS